MTVINTCYCGASIKTHFQWRTNRFWAKHERECGSSQLDYLSEARAKYARAQRQRQLDAEVAAKWVDLRNRAEVAR